MAEPIRETEYQNLNATGQNLSLGETEISSFIVLNNTRSGAYVQIFNQLAANVTLGQTVPRFQMYAGPSINNFEQLLFIPPVRFDTALSAFATTLYNGSTGVSTGVSLQAIVGL